MAPAQPGTQVSFQRGAGMRSHQVGSGCGLRGWLGSALDTRLVESTAEPQSLGWIWDREGEQVQQCNQFVGGAAIP